MPVALGHIRSSGAARMSGNPYAPNGYLEIEHRELIKQVLSSETDFHVFAIDFNPGLGDTMPWASNLARNFDEWEMVSASITFASESSSLQTGYVMLGCDYDPVDPPPASKSRLAQYHGAQIFNPWLSKGMIFDRSELRRQARYFTRYGPPPAGTDIRLYDPLRIYVAVGGNTNTAVSLGDLWISYKLRLYTPQQRDEAVVDGNSWSFQFPNIDNIFAPGNMTDGGSGGLGVKFTESEFQLNRSGTYNAEFQFDTNILAEYVAGVNPTLVNGLGVPMELISSPADIIVTGAHGVGTWIYEIVSEVLGKDNGGSIFHFTNLPALFTIGLTLNWLRLNIRKSSHITNHGLAGGFTPFRPGLDAPVPRPVGHRREEKQPEAPARPDPRSPRQGTVFFPDAKSGATTPAGVGGTFVAVPREPAARSTSSKR